MSTDPPSTILSPEQALKDVYDHFTKEGIQAMPVGEMVGRYYRRFATTRDAQHAAALWIAWVDEHPDDAEIATYADTRRKTTTPEQQVALDKAWGAPVTYQTVFDP